MDGADGWLNAWLCAPVCCLNPPPPPPLLPPPPFFPQAVLPLRGKILNIERKDDAGIYRSEELQNLILGLGLGLRVSEPERGKG